MIYTICEIVVISFALVGIVDVYKNLSLAMYCPKINNSIMILPIGKDSNNTEFIVRGAAAKVRWLNIIKNQQIVCLDCGMNDESREICSRLAEKYPFISIKTVDELKEFLSKEIP